jgi:hypothetical protein
MTVAYALVAAVLASASSGCMTASVRIRGGPTLGTDGVVGWEMGAALGLGWSLTESTSLRSLPAVATSDRGTSFGTSLEVGAITERVAWHAGIAGEGASTGREIVSFVYGAGMRPLWFRERYSSDGKSTFLAHSRVSLAIGLEARAGLALDRDTESSRGLFALLPVLDLTTTIFD